MFLLTSIFGALLLGGLLMPSGDVDLDDSDHITNDDEATNASDLSDADVDALEIATPPYATGQADIIGGSEMNDVFDGLDGDDQINGYAGHDVLSGGNGNDRLDGYSGNDSINGGNGLDWIFGGDGYDSIEGGAGDDTLFGGAGLDAISGDAGNDEISGGTGNDTLLGGSGDDKIRGDDGDDLLRGQAGNDTLFGGDGNDILLDYSDSSSVDYLNGGNGNDTIYSIGADVLTGGAGFDEFVLDTTDIEHHDAAKIMDFNSTEDTLEIMVPHDADFASEPAEVNHFVGNTYQVSLGGHVVAILNCETAPNPTQIKVTTI